MKHFKLKVLVQIISVLLVQNALADCEIWKVEVLDVMTHETKTYSFHLGEIAALPLPKMKNYKCTIKVTSSGSGGKTAILECDHHYDTKSISSSGTGASCHGNARQTGGFTIFDSYKGKPASYIIDFRPSEIAR